MENPGMIIKTARKGAGLTQKQLAERTGLREDTIGKYERGARHPGRPHLQILADALGVSIQVFYPQPAAGPSPEAGKAPYKAEYAPLRFGPDFGRNLAMAREAAGLGKAELAMRAGLSRDSITNYEAGRVKRPSPRNLLRLADVLGVPACDLAPECGMKPAAGASEDGRSVRRLEDEPHLNRFGQTLGESLRRAREAAGLSIAELARRTGTSPGTLREYESGTAIQPCFARMERIAGVLGVSVYDLAPEYAFNPRCAGAPVMSPEPAPESRPEPEPASGSISRKPVPESASRKREPVSDTAPARADQRTRWLSLAAEDGAEVRYFNGRLSELLYGMTPEGIRSVTAYAEFIRQQAGR